MATPAAVLSILVKTQGAQAAAAQLGGIDKSGRAAAGGIAKAEGQAKRSSKTFSALGSAAKGAGLLIGAAGLAEGLGAAVSEYREAQKVGGQTTAVLKSTGSAANVSAKHINNLAASISKKSGIDDEAIQSSENMLLTFTKVRNETGKGNKIFDQATQTVTDMSAALGQSGKSSAIQLGKALNDPIKGITALRRVGVSFTKDQQKQITTLENTGHHLDAQKIILKELRTEFAGSAAAQATAGDKFKVSLGNLAEAAGAVLVPAMDKVLPVLTRFFDQMVTGTGVGGALISKFKEFGGALAPLGQSIQTIVGFLKEHEGISKVLAIGIGVLTAAVVAFNIAVSLNPFVAVGIALAALVVGVVAAYQQFGTFRAIVDTVFSVVKTVVTTAIAVAVASFNAMKTAASAVASVVSAAWNAVASATSTVWNTIKAVVTGVWNGIKTAANVVWEAIKIAITVATLPLRATLYGIWLLIGNQIKAVWNALKVAASAVWNAIKTVVIAVVNGLKTALSAAWNAIKTVTTTAWNAYKTAIIDPIRNAVSFVKDKAIGPLVGWLKGRWDAIAKGAGAFASSFKDGVSNAFKGAANAVIGFINAIIKAINVIPGMPNIGLIPTIGGGGDGGQAGAPGGRNAGAGKAQAAFARGGAFGLTNGVVNAPMVMMGEEAPTHPEFVIPTNPAYRKRAQALLAQAAGTIGGMAKGGVLGAIGGAIAGGAKGLLGKLPGVGDLPSWMKGMGSFVLGKVGSFIKDKVTDILPGGGGGGGGSQATSTSGLVPRVLAAVAFARAHGWKGQITSGFRSDAEQVRIWNSGIRPAAKPKSLGGPGSNHSLGQAVDVSDIPGFQRAMNMMPADKRLYSRVANDPVHFSVTGHRKGGIVRAFAKGGVNVAIAAARRAGFKGADLVNMIAIAGRESGYNPGAQNLVPPDHSIGLWQINQLAHHGRFGTDAQLKDPYTNAKAAFALSGGGHNLSPWQHAGGPLGGTNVAAARAAVEAFKGGTSTGGGGNSAAGGGGGGAAPAAAKVNPFDQKIANADLAIQQAQRGTVKVGAGLGARKVSSSLQQIQAKLGKRQLIGKRIKSIRKALKGKLSPTKRLALTQELTQRLQEHSQLGTEISELRQPVAADTPTAIGDIGGGVGGAAGDGADPNQALIDSNAALQASIDAQAQAEKEHADALRGVRDELKRQTDFASAVQQTENFQLKKMLADVVSGQIGGYGVAPRSYTPSGSGLGYAY